MNKELNKENIVSAYLFLERHDIVVDVFTISVACAYISNSFIELKEKIDFLVSSNKQLGYDFVCSLFSEYITINNKAEEVVDGLSQKVEHLREVVSSMVESNAKYNALIDEELKKVASLEPSLALAISMIHDSIEGIKNNTLSSKMSFNRFIEYLDSTKKEVEENYLSKNKDFLTGFGNINYQKFIFRKSIAYSAKDPQYCAMITLKNDSGYDDKIFLSILRYIKNTMVEYYPHLMITRVSRNSFVINFDTRFIHEDFIKLKKLVHELMRKEFVYKVNGSKVDKMDLNVVLNQIYEVDEADKILSEMLTLSQKDSLFISNCVI
jgi:hypothetical protein